MTPFSPVAGATLAATDASTRTALPGGFTGAQQRTVRLYNAGPAVVFVQLGGATVTASTSTSMALPAGVVEVLSTYRGDTHLPAICAAGLTASLRITTGEGA